MEQNPVRDSDGRAAELRSHRDRRGWRKIAFPLWAILLGLAPLAILEVALWFLDIGRPQHGQDPFVGFGQVHSLFEHNPESSEFRTSNSRLRFFSPQSFSGRKPENGFRVFCLGGSTVLGHPYQPDTAFSEWLAIELAGRDPSRSIEVINCGGISYASYRSLPILAEVLGYEPDLIIVATGHNEFLEDRTYRNLKARSTARAWLEDCIFSLRTMTLLRGAVVSLRKKSGLGSKEPLNTEVDVKLDHESGYASYHRDRGWQESVLREFRKNLLAMVRRCQEANVPLIFINLGSNLRDCPPFKSEHRSGIDIAELEAWKLALEEGSRLETKNPQEALEHYRRAEELDDQHAHSIYRIARCLDRLGRHDQAREAYLEAKDSDVCPLRMSEALHEVLFEVTQQQKIQLIEARGLLEERSPNRLVGSNFYLDHVHPNIAGHQLIARALAETLQRQELVRATAPWTEVLRRRARRRHLDQLGELYLSQGRHRVEWLNDWARRDRIREGPRTWDPRSRLEVGHSYLDFGRPQKAREVFTDAMTNSPDLAVPLLDHAFSLFRQGRPNAASQAAEVVWKHASEPEMQISATVALFILALEEGRLEKARKLYEPARAAFAEPSSIARQWIREMPDALKRIEDSQKSPAHGQFPSQ